MKILAVDDDPIILELLSQFIGELGQHNLTTVTSGAEALEAVRTARVGKYDCFLFDVQMPAMDGIELTSEIRKLSDYKATPIIMLTAMSDKQYIDAAFSAGSTDYITKPFEFLDLKGRLSLAESLVQARQSRTRKVFSAQAISEPSDTQQAATSFELLDPILIYDVDNVIENVAMENYISQLSRTAVFASTVFAFTIRKVEEHHRGMSRFEFSSLVSDVAEIISDTLCGNQFLMTYAGNGTFVCVTESGWRPDTSALMDAINLSLSRTELYDNQGQQLYVRVSVGKAVRLVWQSKENVMEAFAAAHRSAEEASAAYDRRLNDFWSTG